jgi:hypothetical protein
MKIIGLTGVRGDLMAKLAMCLGFGVLGLTLIVGAGSSQDKEKKEPKGAKGLLPSGWKELSLTKEQVLQVYAVQEKFKAKIKDLEEQIKTLKVQEKQELVKVLTADQKALLIKLTTGVDIKENKKEPEKERGIQPPK